MVGLGPPALLSHRRLIDTEHFRTLFYFKFSFVVEALRQEKADSSGEEGIIPSSKDTCSATVRCFFNPSQRFFNLVRSLIY